MHQRSDIIKAMAPGGIVTDGRRGKLHESMLNCLYIEGLTITPLYWTTKDMESKIKDGHALAEVIKEIKEEMEAASEPGKVRTLTTDRASANKFSWELLKDHGLEGVPDAVHVHHSIMGDLFKSVKIFDSVSLESKTIVETFRKKGRRFSVIGGVCRLSREASP